MVEPRLKLGASHLESEALASLNKQLEAASVSASFLRRGASSCRHLADLLFPHSLSYILPPTPTYTTSTVESIHETRTASAKLPDPAGTKTDDTLSSSSKCHKWHIFRTS